MNKGKAINQPATYAKWTTGEIEILRRDYPAMGARIPELLERHPINSIYGKARKLGIVKADVPSKKTYKTHMLANIVYRYDEIGKTACGHWMLNSLLAWETDKVTCGRCKATMAYKTRRNK